MSFQDEETIIIQQNNFPYPHENCIGKIKFSKKSSYNGYFVKFIKHSNFCVYTNQKIMVFKSHALKPTGELTKLLYGVENE